jgi:predicted DNA binding CopG/RHH family protein
MTERPAAVKTVPTMTTDAEAEAFLDQDLSDLDFSQFKPLTWETSPKSARVNMRLPEALMAALKAKAAKRGIPYQRLIREALERELAKP